MNKSRKIKLFCFPFAGGSQYSYTFFNRYLPDFIELIPIDLPGRGSRFSEPLLDDLQEMVTDLFEQIKTQLDAPFAFYGHSMGTMLAYLLTEKLQENGKNLPQHIFLSGRAGPKFEETDRNWHSLPKMEFRQKLHELGGSPKEVLEEEKIMELIEPILRADFKAVELFTYKQIRAFDVPVTVMIGSEERVTKEEALSWQEISTFPLQFHQFEGGHFFIFDHSEKIVKVIQRELSTF